MTTSTLMPSRRPAIARLPVSSSECARVRADLVFARDIVAGCLSGYDFPSTHAVVRWECVRADWRAVLDVTRAPGGEVSACVRLPGGLLANVPHADLEEMAAAEDLEASTHMRTFMDTLSGSIFAGRRVPVRFVRKYL